MEPDVRGLAYLYRMRALAIEPELILMVSDPAHRVALCDGIATQIAIVNATLESYLQACHECFHPWQRRSMQVFAVPFTDAFGLDGLCNLHSSPITLLVDVGRVMPADWLALIAHEYAHAHLALPGHQAEFAQILSHLCLGLGLALPAAEANLASWQSWPPLRRTADPLQFWLELSSLALSQKQG
jgi:hypothetical protein